MTDVAIGLGQILASDPEFDQAAFLKQAGETMMAVKAALQMREPFDVREMVSDDVFSQLREEVMNDLSRGAVHHYDALGISQATVAAAEHSATGDQITVLLQAAAMQYTIGETQDPDSMSMPMMPFSEYWTFSRPPGAGSAVPARPECPTCGAPVDIDTGRICRYCKTLLPPPGRQPGWTVVAITPATENV